MKGEPVSAYRCAVSSAPQSETVALPLLGAKGLVCLDGMVRFHDAVSPDPSTVDASIHYRRSYYVIPTLHHTKVG